MSDSLYDKYGGFASICDIVHKFYDKILESETLSPWFEHVDMEGLIDHQTQFLCMALGGPANYSGHGMKKVHQGLQVTEAAFNEVAVCLKESLDESGVEAEDIDTILQLVGGFASEVIEA